MRPDSVAFALLALLASPAFAQPIWGFYTSFEDPLAMRGEPNTRMIIKDELFLEEGEGVLDEEVRAVDFDDDGFTVYNHNLFAWWGWPLQTVTVTSVSGDPDHPIIGIEPVLHEDVIDVNIIFGDTTYTGELPGAHDTLDVSPSTPLARQDVNVGDELLIRPVGPLSGPVIRDAGVLTREGRTPNGTLIVEEKYYYGRNGLTRIVTREYDHDFGSEILGVNSHCLTYDDAGRVASEYSVWDRDNCTPRDASGTRRYRHDDEGRILEETYTPNDRDAPVPRSRFAYTDRFLRSDEVTVSSYTPQGNAEALTTYTIDERRNRITYRSTDPTGSYPVATPNLVKSLAGMGYRVPFIQRLAPSEAGHAGVVEYRDDTITLIRATHPEDRDDLTRYRAHYEGDRLQRIEVWDGDHMERRVTVEIQPAPNDD